MEEIKLKELAKKLHVSASNAQPISQLSSDHHFDLDDAYAIERLLIQERVNDGNSITGIKMGFTSIAKMEQMGVHDMIWGILTSDMTIGDGHSTPLAKYIHPRAEPEICFRLSKDITKEIALADLDDYVDAIAPAIEIIDSRYENFKFSLEDVVADNCSSTGYVVGSWQAPSREISNLAMRQYFGDELVAEGSSADILGDPWKSLQAASRLVEQYDMKIAAGQIVLAGAATAAVFLKPNTTVRVEVEGMEPVSFHTS